MRTTPTTALIAVTACATGLLTSWYVPGIIPGAIFGVLAYTATLLALAAAFRQDRDTVIAGGTLLLVRGLAAAIQTAASGTLWCLRALAQVLDEWAHQPKQTTTTTYIHAA
jgi:hypothetical protein